MRFCFITWLKFPPSFNDLIKKGVEHGGIEYNNNFFIQIMEKEIGNMIVQKFSSHRRY